MGQVIKYAGGVSKSFSTIIGIILTGIAEYFLYEQAESYTRTGLLHSRRRNCHVHLRHEPSRCPRRRQETKIMTSLIFFYLIDTF